MLRPNEYRVTITGGRENSFSMVLTRKPPTDLAMAAIEGFINYHTMNMVNYKIVVENLPEKYWEDFTDIFDRCEFK